MSFTVIIPAYNESKSIEKVLSTLEEIVQNGEIIVVDDCSTDNTMEVARKFPSVKVIQQPFNQGPISAIAAGMAAASFDVIVTIDADGQHPVESISDIVNPVIKNDADIVLGVRKSLPRLGEKIIALFSGVSDATTGFKAMKKAQVKNFKDDFAFGGMLIVKARREGSHIVEIPIKIRERSEGASVHSNFNILKKALKFVIWRLTKK